jgi:uncharacterized protein (TIGR02466 family)|tara:strand:- start:155 stop:826 length:672 start_codon:yes stop_codon:yes gene_type:complete
MNALDTVTKFVNGDDTLLHVFPTSILLTKYPNSLKDEFGYIQNLDYTSPNATLQNHNTNSKSVDTFILKHKALSNIKNFIYDSLKKYTIDVLASRQKLIITQSWVNKNESGTGHPTHLHQNSIISGIFCFKQDSTMPSTQFYNRYIPSNILDPENYNSMNCGFISMPMVDGDLVLFPSDLMHSVHANQSTEARYSLSFNTFSGELGHDGQLTYLNMRELNVNN